MTIFSKKRRAEKRTGKMFGNLAAFFGHPFPLGADPSEVFSVAETVEALGRIAAETADWHHYFVLLRAWAQFYYRSIVYIGRGLGYLLYRARFWSKHPWSFRKLRTSNRPGNRPNNQPFDL